MTNPKTTPPHRQTFDAWIAKHMAILHHVANGFATGEDRDDLLQEILFSLWRAVPAYKGNSKVSTFIYTVSHNTALTWHRGRRNYSRRIVKAQEFAQASHITSQAVTPDPD